MSAKHDHLNNSDSEDDGDYIPPEKLDSDSEQSDAGGKDEINQVALEKVDGAAKKREREALWSSFQASVAGSSTTRNADLSTQRMVKIKRKFRFAGKEVIEVVEVPENSDEAKKWPLWSEDNGEADGNLTHSSGLVSSIPHPPSSPETTKVATSGAIDNMTLVGGKDTPQSTVESTTETKYVSVAPVAEKSTPRRPGPRKSKTLLAPLPGPSKAKKMTTLDKSALDWRSHIHTGQETGTSINDELEANRRAGGYLEKVDFLKRVEERKEETLGSLKGNKRRKL